MIHSDNTRSHRCLVCLGSNHDPDTKLDAALEAIAEHFNILNIGKRIMTEPEGTDAHSKPYLNQAIIIESYANPDEIISIFKLIERQNGRTAESKSSGIVPLDIDLLVYDEQILKPADMEKAYVISAVSSLSDM